MTTERLQRYFNEYHSFHTTAGNVATHYFGIPMIMVALLSLLAQIHSGESAELIRLDGGMALWAFGTLFYLYLDWKIGVPFGVVAFGAYLLGRAVPLPVAIALFALGWVLQYVGHLKYEKRSPAFYKNLEHLLIGPLWIFSKLVGYSKPNELKSQ